MGAPPIIGPVQLRRWLEQQMIDSLKSRRSLLGLAVISLARWSGGVDAQAPSSPAPSTNSGAGAPTQPAGGAPIIALVDQMLDLFPKVSGEVIEVQGDVLMLDVG